MYKRYLTHQKTKPPLRIEIKKKVWKLFKIHTRFPFFLVRNHLQELAWWHLHIPPFWASQIFHDKYSRRDYFRVKIYSHFDPLKNRVLNPSSNATSIKQIILNLKIFRTKYTIRTNSFHQHSPSSYVSANKKSTNNNYPQFDES